MRHRSVMSRGLMAALALGVLGASDPPPQPPGRLSETGLYGADGAVDPRNRPFAPQYPLWTDGAVKSRWIRLPEGARIDVTDVDVWRFPVGTRLWKEFAWDGRKVETRMLWHANEDTWVFATYVWNEAQTDAVLAPDGGVRNAYAVAPGRSHSIPGALDCRSCHLSSPAVVLGFSALQLSDDRDPLAPHAEALRPGMLTIRALAAEGRLDPPRPELVSHPPRIRTNDPLERAALGYLSANCGGCHNAAGPLAGLGMELLHREGDGRDAPERVVATAVDAPSRWAAPGVAPEDSRRISPGAPERSTVVQRMQSRRRSSQMPPLGTTIADEQALDLVARWVRSLGPTS